MHLKYNCSFFCLEGNNLNKSSRSAGWHWYHQCMTRNDVYDSSICVQLVFYSLSDWQSYIVCQIQVCNRTTYMRYFKGLSGCENVCNCDHESNCYNNTIHIPRDSDVYYSFCNLEHSDIDICPLSGRSWLSKQLLTPQLSRQHWYKEMSIERDQVR